MRRLWILFLMAIMVLIVGCQKQNPDINSTITQDSNINSAADQVHHETPFMIILF